MRLTVRRGAPMSGTAAVPGDKSVAHRWLILASIADGESHLRGVPASLDVRSTASGLAVVLPHLRPALEGWVDRSTSVRDADGFTTDGPEPRPTSIRLEGRGRASIEGSDVVLDCGNSGTTMRLLSGLLAAHAGPFELTGDESLRRRPMERVARPLRAMGARVTTTEGRPPVVIRGGGLTGCEIRGEVPSAQVKGAVLLAGLAAEGRTTFLEAGPSRDHTERALLALGAPATVAGESITVEPFQLPSFEGLVPGDPSSAAFLLAAAALSGGGISVEGVGLNPSRIAFIDIMRRMGVETEVSLVGTSVGEPYGSVTVEPGASLRGTPVGAEELPLVIDEVPVLAALAAHAAGETRFEGAAELRVKESDRLTAMSEAVRAAGGEASVEGDALVIGGGGLEGGTVDPAGDHRVAMALAVAGVASGSPVTVEGAECAEISFPGFAAALRSLGADVEG